MMTSLLKQGQPSFAATRSANAWPPLAVPREMVMIDMAPPSSLHVTRRPVGTTLTNPVGGVNNVWASALDEPTSLAHNGWHTPFPCRGAFYVLSRARHTGVNRSPRSNASDQRW